MKKLFLVFLMAFALLAVSCFAKGKITKGDSMASYKSVSMAEGLELMKNDRNYILLDVRTLEEYDSGHIPGALQLTNETFTKEDAEKILKNKNQNIYVYCRSGRRSKNSSQKLIDFGYTSVIEIGGIMSYSGNLEY